MSTKPKAKKKNTAKKTTAKKKSSKKSVKITNPQNKKLIKQLLELAGGLDEEGILFLIQQANVLHYNKQIDALNQNMSGNSSAGSTASTSDKIIQTKHGIVPDNKHACNIAEGDDGSYFMIEINSSRNIFDREEMKKLVKLCHAARDEKDGANRLFVYFNRERKDVIKNIGIFDQFDASLPTIYEYIISHYTVKQ